MKTKPFSPAKLLGNGTSLLYSILIIASWLVACRGPEAKESVSDTSGISSPLGRDAGEKYAVDTRESFVAWNGTMVFTPNEDHPGYVYVSKGELIIDKEKLVGGAVEMNMNTIQYKDKLHPNSPIKHLKSEDFFDVERFPTSTFVITKVEELSGDSVKVIGNMTIKDVTQAIDFPVKVGIVMGVVSANGKVVIDRTRWGIRYKSGKFYDNLADEAISDEIELEMKVVARRKW